MRSHSLLLLLAVGVVSQDPCGTTRIQSVVESFYGTCMQEESSQIDWRGNCGSLDTMERQRACEWGNRYGSIFLMNSLSRNCDAASQDPITVNTSLSEVPQDICNHKTDELRSCVARNNITAVTPVPKSGTIFCDCIASHRRLIFQCPFLFSLADEMPPVSSYYNFTEIRNSCSPSCNLDSIPLQETNETMIFALTISVRSTTPAETFKKVISSSISSHTVTPSQVNIVYWSGLSGQEDRFSVNFFLMNVPSASVVLVVDALNESISDPESILRHQLAAEPHFLMEANTPEPSPPPPIIVQEDEVPDSMIAVTIVLGLLLLFVAIGYVIVVFVLSAGNDPDQDSRDEEEEEEEEGPVALKEEDPPKAAA